MLCVKQRPDERFIDVNVSGRHWESSA
jgi:hypothetical protein